MNSFKIGQRVIIKRILVNGNYISLQGEVIGYCRGRDKGKLLIRANSTFVCIAPDNLEAVTDKL